VVPNSSYDRITDFRVKEYLKTPAGVWKDATVELKVPYEFDTGNPIPLFKWKEVVESTHKREWFASTLECQLTLKASTTKSGTKQGPWVDAGP